MKIKNLIFFLALLTLLISIVSAADVSEDVSSTSDVNEQVMQDTQSEIVNDNNNINDNIQTEKNVKTQISDNTTKVIEEDTYSDDIEQTQTDENLTIEENINDISENESTEDADDETIINNPTITVDNKNIKEASNDDGDVTDSSNNGLLQQIKDSLLNIDVDSLIISLNNTINNLKDKLNASGRISELNDTLNNLTQKLDNDDLINSLNQSINSITENINSGNWINSLNDNLANLTENLNTSDLINKINGTYTNLTDKITSGDYLASLNEDINNLKEKINSGDYAGVINDTVNKLSSKLNASDLISLLNDTLNTITDNINSGNYTKLLNDSANNLTDKLNTSNLIDSLDNALDNLTDNLNASGLIDSINGTYNNISQKINITGLLDSLNKTLNDLKQRLNSTTLPNSTDVINNITQRLNLINLINSIQEKLNVSKLINGSKDISTIIKEIGDLYNQVDTIKNLIDQLLHPTHNIKVIATPTSGILGEKLVLNAIVTDSNDKMINEGYVIFKINGITLKDDGKLTGTSLPLKVRVLNGVAATAINLDLDMKSATKYIASYLGTKKYNSSVSNEAKIQVSKRNASIEVSSDKKTIKQGQVLTITAKVYDTTKGKKSTNLTKYDDEFVFFKVNGITLKDSNGQMLKAKIKNGIATVNYTIPLGLSCVTDGKTMTIKNHTILAQFYNKNYQEDIRNTSTFQVEKSNITLTITNATVNNKTHKLSLKTTIKDYLGNIVKGPNKFIIKINGITLKNDTQAMYYYSTDGILNLENIDIPSLNKYTNIEVVTQDRLAYNNQRNTTTEIKVLN
ncbi:MAG: hypothetical protein BZ133_02635 [Methanosphaera sp. SHI613]|nr:MAG: hypothetical protein BZ133_02635 [Methanosphaera sp. SHI613]